MNRSSFVQWRAAAPTELLGNHLAGEIGAQRGDRGAHQLLDVDTVVVMRGAMVPVEALEHLEPPGEQPKLRLDRRFFLAS